MNNYDAVPDWSLLQSFASVGKHGSLSAAARATGGSQPTMSRHISQLESDLGVRLFVRDNAGIALTEPGIELMEHVQEMADAASRLALARTADAAQISGTVRITASRIVATYVLPDILTRLHLEQPDIELEVVASDETHNLLRREADIALRMYRPTQSDVIARKVSDLEIGMFAAHSYVERRGLPESLPDILNHDVIGYDRSSLIIDGMKRAGYSVDRDFFAFRSDDQVVCWNMVLAGFGIGFNQVEIGRADPRVVRIETGGSVGTMPIWLAAHKELKTSPRVRGVFDFLVDAFTAKRAQT